MAKSLIEQYLEAKAKGIDHTGKAASRNTIRAYFNAVNLAERLLGKSVNQFTEDDIDELITKLEASDRAPSTRNLVISALRGFFDWALYKEKRVKIKRNPMHGISRKVNTSKVQRRHILTEQQVLALVEAIEENEHKAAEARKDPTSAFNRFGWPTEDQSQKYSLVTRLLFYGGLRVSEALSLRKDQVIDTGLLVHGKGDKYRFVPLKPSLKKELDAFIADAPIQNTPYVFVGDRARDEYEANPLSYTHYLRRFKAAAQQIGLPHDLTPHSLRHSFGTLAMARNKRLEVVQDLLGHADPATTRIYAQLAREDITEEYNKVFSD